MDKYEYQGITVKAEQWFPGKHVDGVVAPSPNSTTQWYPFVSVGDETITVMPGDWIVTTPIGSKYLCRKDMFEKWYRSIK